MVWGGERKEREGRRERGEEEGGEEVEGEEKGEEEGRDRGNGGRKREESVDSKPRKLFVYNITLLRPILYSCYSTTGNMSSAKVLLRVHKVGGTGWW